MLTPIPEIYTDSVTIVDAMAGKIIIPAFYVSYDQLWANADDLDKDKKVRKKISKYFHTKATDKWLYNDSDFEPLTWYFTVTKDDKGCHVNIEKDLKTVSKKKFTDEEKKCIFMFIENYFLTEKFMYNVLDKFANMTKTKWYDLYQNSKLIKDFLRHELKKLIKKTILKM
jgi:hypothetical protein